MPVNVVGPSHFRWNRGPDLFTTRRLARAQARRPDAGGLEAQPPIPDFPSIPDFDDDDNDDQGKPSKPKPKPKRKFKEAKS